MSLQQRSGGAPYGIAFHNWDVFAIPSSDFSAGLPVKGQIVVFDLLGGETETTNMLEGDAASGFAQITKMTALNCLRTTKACIMGVCLEDAVAVGVPVKVRVSGRVKALVRSSNVATASRDQGVVMGVNPATDATAFECHVASYLASGPKCAFTTSDVTVSSTAILTDVIFDGFGDLVD